jgi:hypothetical protein
VQRRSHRDTASAACCGREGAGAPWPRPHAPAAPPPPALLGLGAAGCPGSTSCTSCGCLPRCRCCLCLRCCWPLRAAAPPGASPPLASASGCPQPPLPPLLLLLCRLLHLLLLTFPPASCSLPSLPSGSTAHVRLESGCSTSTASCSLKGTSGALLAATPAPGPALPLAGPRRRHPKRQISRAQAPGRQRRPMEAIVARKAITTQM